MILCVCVCFSCARLRGAALEDPGDFAKRVTKLMESMGAVGGGGTMDAEAAGASLGSGGN